jgi:PAS domain S-box-containing protein
MPSDPARAVDCHARLASIVDSCEDAIASKTVDGIITSWDRSAERIFGYSADEVLGEPITIIVPRERAPEAQEVLARIARGERVRRLETVRVRKDGTKVDISLTVSPIKDSSNQVVGASKIARDVTSIKSAERRLLFMAFEAEQANRAKELLAAMLGHELRNPLGAISSALDVIDAGSNENTRLAREVLRRQLGVLTRYTEELIETARLITGRVLLENAPIDLSRAVGRAMAGMRAAGRFDRHEVSLSVEPTWINGDGMRVEQIVTHLLGNALKFTPDGGYVRVLVMKEKLDAVLGIEDSGIGIERDLLPFIFDLFVQGQRRLRANGGLGMGLTIVRRLTELHGGLIYASSPGPGRGSRFTVRFPSDERPVGWHPDSPGKNAA